MPVKSAWRGSKACAMPSVRSVSPSESDCAGFTSNFGSATATRWGTRAATSSWSRGSVSDRSTASRPSTWSGRMTSIAMSRPRYGSSSTFTPSFSTNRSVSVWCIVGTLFRLGPGRGERRRLRCLLLERGRPVSQEVDRVDEDEARRAVDGPGRDQVADAPLRLLLDPAVDPLPRLIRRSPEVERLEGGAVRSLRRLEVGRLEPVGLLAEEPVGDAEGDRALRVGERGRQSAGRLHRLGRGAVEAERRLHLLRRLAPGAAPRHREGCRHARR